MNSLYYLALNELKSCLHELVVRLGESDDLPPLDDQVPLVEAAAHVVTHRVVSGYTKITKGEFTKYDIIPYPFDHSKDFFSIKSS